ncbi:helix-turn-helix domain-containing protein [Dyadobacter psychrotolerans]|uniref:AraC family transcriptional regulator n=1 Tax=Dyadobacter psychrotolerans TaxID=2541721 RepID=A0A4R5DS86_9BACT|nr:helix-turn-helix domain-containing protein [Dyadobacter psychrotolerans]TDE17292.1 AraC family transcriptional regulator [Dyadobacter psychrotolerans]
MEFTRIMPHTDLEGFIECYWMMYSQDSVPQVEKIIPDGFTEIIFNYADVYKSKINGDWTLQSPNLMAGQLKTFFYLRNTGRTGSIAIKLKPAALTQLFGFSMDQYLDKIIDLDSLQNPELGKLKKILDDCVKLGCNRQEQFVKKILDEYFVKLIETAPENPLEGPLNLIFNSNGLVTVSDMVAVSGIGERQLERLFKKYIGLSPKYYARIIRFNYIFQLIKSKENSWAEIVYQSGFYDQSHFIHNFKAFTGEDPSAYFFGEKNMANFFLNK